MCRDVTLDSKPKCWPEHYVLMEDLDVFLSNTKKRKMRSKAEGNLSIAAVIWKKRATEELENRI